jgi:subtilisin family serine protease
MKFWKTVFAAAAAVLGIGAAQAGPLISDQYIVVLKSPQLPGVSSVLPVAQNLLGRVGGGELLHVYGSALNGFAIRVPAIAAQALAANPLVASVEQDQTFRLVATQFNPPYGLDRIDQRDLPLSTTYTYAGMGASAHVYDIDTGLRASHTDFAGRVGNGRNFAANSTGSILCQLLGIGCPAPDPNNTNDCNGHGTHTAGTAVGTTFGVAKGAIIHPVRVFGCGNSTATSTIIAGVDWVSANRVAGRSVANMSLGGGASAALDTAVTNLINQGVTVAIAAGNESGADACGSSPARVAAGITVGATTSTDARASFSNIGTCLDLFAPGNAVVSASSTSDTGSVSLSGTSMSAPHVAGAAARYLAANPNASPASVQSALIAASTPNKVTNAGAGSPNRLLYVDPAGP